MSVVSGVTLICALVESDSSDDGAPKILAWLKQITAQHAHVAYSQTFAEISEQYGGGKQPQHFTFGAGINHLDEAAFAAAVMHYRWQEPTEVVLIVRSENGETRVWRPG